VNRYFSLCIYEQQLEYITAPKSLQSSTWLSGRRRSRVAANKQIFIPMPHSNSNRHWDTN